MIRVQQEAFDAADVLSAFTASAGQGAIATFIGTVRGDGGVETLTLDHYPGFTEKQIATLVDTVTSKHRLTSATVIHRFGTMAPGETILFAATAAPHRRAAIDALDELVELLKTDAPFWKKERRDDGEHWLEPPAGAAMRPSRETNSEVEHAVGIAVLTVSDSRDEASDTSGAYLAAQVRKDGHRLAGKAIVPDDIGAIRTAVRRWVDDPAVDVVISTGGTGLTGRDVTPEAVQPLFDKVIDGFTSVWHRVSFEQIGLSTMQSRACAGLIERTLVFCLPGSNGAVRDGWTKVIGPQLDRSTKPCNFVEIMPRMEER